MALSLCGADAATACFDQLFERREVAAVGLTVRLEQGRDLRVLEVRPDAVGADHEHVAVLERLAPRDRHLRKHGLAAEAALDEVAHRMGRDLVLADRAVAQQLLDVAVVARAGQPPNRRACDRHGCRRREPSTPPGAAPGRPRRSRAGARPPRAGCRSRRLPRARGRSRGAGSRADRIAAWPRRETVRA